LILQGIAGQPGLGERPPRDFLERTLHDDTFQLLAGFRMGHLAPNVRKNRIEEK
jgi:hypothetical protein